MGLSATQVVGTREAGREAGVRGPAWEEARLARAEAAAWQVLSAKCADGTGGTLQVADTGCS